MLLLDSSGSMKRTDPERLRVPAAQLFVSLLQPEDRAAVVSFSDAGYPVVRLTEADPDGRQRLVAGIDKVSSKGAFTNLHAALSQGLALLEPSDPDRRRYLILLSDGHMDTGDEAGDRELIQRIRQQLLPALQERNVKVYSIAFTQESDIELLRSIAVATDGVFQLIENQNDLHKAFADIFENAKSPNMLPLDEGRFQVDDSVRELTVVATLEPGEETVRLHAPDGMEMAYRDHPAPVRWMHSPRFDLITVPEPAPGTWSLTTGAGGNRAYVVTDLELKTHLETTQLQQGNDLRLRAWLTDGGEPLLRPEVLSTTEFLVELSLPDGSQRTVALRAPGEDGVSAATLPMEQIGPVRVTVTARSATFERQTRHLLQVVAAQQPAAPPPPAFVVPPIEIPVPVHPAPAPAKPSPAPASKPETERDAPASAVESDSEPLQFTTVLLVFLVVNAVLAILIVAVLLWRRRRRAGKPAPQATEE